MTLASTGMLLQDCLDRLEPKVIFLVFGSDVNKDLGLKAKAKAKDSRYQGQIFHRSSP